ncbi:MAG TPA: hypothetical protein VM240_14445 [Verrucomicrobiae bacterium]|nr:hypothetical protein [Verrucomicrobiae bacterium]
MKRRVPDALYNQVLAIATAIADHDGVNSVARAELMALFHKHQQAGTPDPFLTETVADFTNDPDEQVRLYRLAIEQCIAVPGEPVHSKRCGLIEALLELRDDGEAQQELMRARLAAFAARDSEAVKDLDRLARRMATER